MQALYKLKLLVNTCLHTAEVFLLSLYTLKPIKSDSDAEQNCMFHFTFKL